MGTVLQPSDNMSYAIEKAEDGNGFFAKVINVKTVCINYAIYDRESNIILLMSSADDIVDFAQPPSDFLFAMNDCLDGAISEIIVDEFGYRLLVTGKAEVKLHKVNVVYTSEIKFNGVHLEGRNEKDEFVYFLETSLPVNPRLVAKSDLSIEQMRKCSANGSEIVIAGIPIPVLSDITYRGDEKSLNRRLFILFNLIMNNELSLKLDRGGYTYRPR